MKNRVLLFALLIASLQVSASDINNKFYVGGEGLINMYTTYDVPGASVLGGYRWDRFSTEIGYTKLANDDWGRGLNFKSYNIFVDGIYSYPIENKLDLKASVGLGSFHTKVNNKRNDFFSWGYRDKEHQSYLGFRAGIGLQYRLSDAWTADLNYRMQTNCNVFIGYMSIYSIGLRYYI